MVAFVCPCDCDFVGQFVAVLYLYAASGCFAGSVGEVFFCELLVDVGSYLSGFPIDLFSGVAPDVVVYEV